MTLQHYSCVTWTCCFLGATNQDCIEWQFVDAWPLVPGWCKVWVRGHPDIPTKLSCTSEQGRVLFTLEASIVHLNSSKKAKTSFAQHRVAHVYNFENDVSCVFCLTDLFSSLREPLAWLKFHSLPWLCHYLLSLKYTASGQMFSDCHFRECRFIRIWFV